MPLTQSSTSFFITVRENKRLLFYKVEDTATLFNFYTMPLIQLFIPFCIRVRGNKNYFFHYNLN